MEEAFLLLQRPLQSFGTITTLHELVGISPENMMDRFQNQALYELVGTESQWDLVIVI